MKYSLVAFVTNHNSFIQTLIPGIVLALTAVAWGCAGRGHASPEAASTCDSLRNELRQIAHTAPGLVGIAVITPDGDTITVNNDSIYQMMSVFKLHQAIAVAHTLDTMGVSLDTIISFPRSEMNPDTWSPMLKEHTEQQLNIPVRELLRYTLQQSDNNASNLMFSRIVSTHDCDRFIREATGINDFSIQYTEQQMFDNHDLADGNHSSPLACARLIHQLFTDSIISPDKQSALQQILLDCQTGLDRIYAPLKDKEGVTLAHKTGSGNRNSSGELMAHNDVGRVMLPDGRTYELAVLVRNFNGTEAEAAAVIAKISAAVYQAFAR